MNNLLIRILLVTCFLYSCSGKRAEYNLVFVLDGPVSTDEKPKYPKYFTELANPFKSECNLDYLPKPISICRLDISNNDVETNAWYFESFGDNTVEFSKI